MKLYMQAEVNEWGCSTCFFSSINFTEDDDISRSCFCCQAFCSKLWFILLIFVSTVVLWWGFGCLYLCWCRKLVINSVLHVCSTSGTNALMNLSRPLSKWDLLTREFKWFQSASNCKIKFSTPVWHTCTLVLMQVIWHWLMACHLLSNLKDVVFQSISKFFKLPK